jgi:hypothetical protein
MFEIPIIFINNNKGAKHIVIDRTRLPYFLSLSQTDIIGLREVGLIQPEARAKIPKMKIDYPSLAQEYRQLLSSGVCKDRADIARLLGVSRAWVSKVMNRST